MALMIEHLPNDCTCRQLAGQSGTLRTVATTKKSRRMEMKREKFSLLPGLLLLLLQQPMMLNAEPALWYRWQSVKTGKYICKQTNPGPGWVQHSGPYLDGSCRVLKRPPP